MALAGFTRNFRPLNILTDEQIEALHRAALEVLWTTGIQLYHRRALELFNRNGCKVDLEGKRVRFPSALVEECLRLAPSSFHARARDPHNSLVMGGNTLYLAPAPGQQTVNLATWEPRVPTRKEYYEAVTVLDALPHLHFFTTYTPYFGFKDVPPRMAMLESLAARLRRSSKFAVAGHSNDSELFAIQMAQALGVEIMGTCTAAPPLTYYDDAIESAFRILEADLPLRIVSAPVMGGSAPATLAGGLVSNLAEVMGGVVLSQLIRPGARIMVLDFAMPMNMNTGAPAFGSVGVCLHIAAFNQIFRGYGIPTYNADGYPGSKRMDFQTGYEKAMRVLITGLSGGSSRPLHGGVYGELSHHPVQAILDDDLAGMVGRFLEGVILNHETLAVDLINEVGPIPGHFLNKQHTRDWWKREQFIPVAADRLTYPEWINSGKKSCLDYARERMEQILSTHKPLPLTEGEEEELERVLEEARSYYSERGAISDEEMAVYRQGIESPGYPYE